MVLLFGQFMLLAAVIVAAGTFLARYGDTIGERSGLGGSLAGLILLAGATSLPEMTVSVNSALLGAPDLAVGDLLGASLFNLLILAAIDLTFHPRGSMLSRMAAAHALSATMAIVLAGIALLSLLVHSEWTFLNIGIGPWMILATYVLGMRLVFYDQRFAIKQMGEPPTSSDTAKIPLSTAIIGFALATLVLFLTAPRLASTADQLAELTGLGHTFIGTTLVALSTTLPELVTTLTAVRIGARDLAVGNIFGSNSFNMAVLPVVDFFYPGALLSSVDATHTITAVSVIIITSIGVMGLLYRAEKRLWLMEPDALLIIVSVFAALWLIYQMRPA